MLAANVVFLVALGQLPASGAAPDAKAMVSQLGAARFADREAAAQALERLGRPALPALRQARSARDPEIRVRASGLVEKIENALLTQPTRVRLDFNDEPLPAVARALSAQTGFKIALYPQNEPRWRRQRVNLRAPEPVAFWKAVDLLCDDAGLQYNANMQGYVGQPLPVFALTDGSMRSVAPVSDHGPFRVSLLGVDYRRQVTFNRNVNVTGAGAVVGRVPPPPRPAAREQSQKTGDSPVRPEPLIVSQFSADLLVAAEPRLSLSQRGPVQIVEALDDRGNSLVARGDDGTGPHRYGSYFGTGGPTLRLQVPLERPTVAGETIKKLRGLVPATVASRRADPLVVPLVDSAGKTFGNTEIRVTVHEVKVAQDPAASTVIEISIHAPDRDTASESGDVAGFNHAMQQLSQQQLQVEIVDSRGLVIPWIQPEVDAETSRIRLTLTGTPQNGQPKELRYYNLSRASTTIPFEFVDVPMP